MTDEPKRPPVSGDLCPLCNHGHIEIYSSPTPKTGVELRTRYLRCSRKNEGCAFSAKQVLPVEEIPRRRFLGNDFAR